MVVWVTVWTWESVPPDPWHHQARKDDRGEGGRIQVVLENVEQCGGEPEQADTGTVLQQYYSRWYQTRTNHPFFFFFPFPSIYHCFLVHITSLV